MTVARLICKEDMQVSQLISCCSYCYNSSAYHMCILCYLQVHIPLTAPSVEERLTILQIHAKSIPLETTASAASTSAAAGSSSSSDTSKIALLTQVASRCHG
jgi:hypothetical protein